MSMTLEANEKAAHLENLAIEMIEGAAKHLALANDFEAARRNLGFVGETTTVSPLTLRLHHVKTSLTLLEGAKRFRDNAKKLRH